MKKDLTEEHAISHNNLWNVNKYEYEYEWTIFYDYYCI